MLCWLVGFVANELPLFTWGRQTQSSPSSAVVLVWPVDNVDIGRCDTLTTGAGVVGGATPTTLATVQMNSKHRLCQLSR